MSIQIIKAESSKAPVFKVLSSFRKAELIPAIIAFVIGLIFLRDGIWDFFIAFIISFIPLYFISLIGYKFLITLTSNDGPFKRVHTYYRDLALQNNFNISYESIGILIDDEAKKIAFTISPSQKRQLTICGYEDVREWYSKENRVTHKDNYQLHRSGAITGGAERTMIRTNFINVVINDPTDPVFYFKVKNQSDSELWVARLNNLING